MEKYLANEKRYDGMKYERCGRSGVLLPRVSLGFWHNFGSVDPYERSREITRYAFDNGITHFDLANNYGPAYGSAEETLGRCSSRRRQATTCGLALTASGARGNTSWQASTKASGVCILTTLTCSTATATTLTHL